MYPLRGIAEGHFGRLADHEVIALANRHVPVGTEYLMAQILNALIQGDDEKQKEGDIGHAAHQRDIALADPTERRKPRARHHGSAKAEGQRHGRGHGKQHQDLEEGHVERHMDAGCQITGGPEPVVQGRWVSAERKHGPPWADPREGAAQGRSGAPQRARLRWITRKWWCRRRTTF